MVRLIESDPDIRVSRLKRNDGPYQGLNISPFKPFSKSDYYEFGGACDIGEDAPIIFDDEEFMCIIISGDCDSNDVVIEVSTSTEDYTENVFHYISNSLRKAINIGKSISRAQSAEEANEMCEDFDFERLDYFS